MNTRPGILIAVYRTLLMFLLPAAVASALPDDAVASPESVGCTPSATTLCLLSSRFAVEVEWRNQHVNPATTGAGTAVANSDQTGFFWFFNSSSIELVVKIVDGRGLNGKFWVFYGALSDVEYTITVTDKQTGAVKTYHNTPDNICGDADTSAFDGASGASSIEASLSTELPAAGARLSPSASAPAASEPAGREMPQIEPSPCVASAQDLCLVSGRFKVSVGWKNQHSPGQTGVGTVIPSSDQSGYFWFFNPSSIELVVKIVDGSALNHSFWVFYGALSDVEYTITVTDTQTGTVKTYHNAPGNICGGADTAYSLGVTAHADSGRAVSNVISPEGGTISATAADGTLFTLTLPDGALLSEETITLTPVASIDHFPLSGGLSAAVELEPEGLLLFQPATLVIHSPVPIPAGQEITFGWRGTGQEFFLFPPDPLGTSSISLHLTHFSGYGAGRGTGADLAAQLARVPADPEDRLAQELQGPAAEERSVARSGSASVQAQALGSIGPSSKASAQAKAIQTETAYLNTVLIPHLPTNCSDDWKSYLNDLEWFRIQVISLTGSDANLLSSASALFDKVIRLLVTCYDTDYSNCKSALDANQGIEMFRIFQALRGEKSSGLVVAGKISSCLTFKLEFTSFIQETEFMGLEFAFNHRVSAEVPNVVLSPFASDAPQPVSAELKYDQASYTGHINHDSGCTLETAGDSSVFQFKKLTADFNVFQSDALPSDWLAMEYDPGHPGYTFTLACPQSPIQIVREARWRDIYEAERHEFTGTFHAVDWTRVQLSGVFAVVKYEPPPDILQTDEISVLTLKHTPQ